MSAADVHELDPDIVAALAADPPDPSTTADLARRGIAVGADADVLRVAALVRCHTERTILGAVLHLDRAPRGLPSLWLAEIGQFDLDMGEPWREVGEASRAGRTTTGRRLATTDAVLIPHPPAVTLTTTVLASCLTYGHVEHAVTVAELIDAGRLGLRRRGPGDTPRHALRLRSA